MRGLLVRGFLLCVIGAASATAWLLLSTSGLQWTVAMLQSRTPGTLTIESVEGRLIGPLSFGGVTYRTDGNSFHAGALELDWRPGRLFSGQIYVTNLTAHDVRASIGPASRGNGSRAAFTGFNVPASVRITGASIDGLQFGHEGESVTKIDHVDLAASAYHDHAVIERLVFTAADDRLSMHGRVPLHPDGELRLSTNWQTEIRGISYRGEGTIGGTMRRIAVTQTLTLPFSATLHGMLDVGAPVIQWQASLEMKPFRIDAVIADAPQLTLAGTVDARGGIDHLNGRLDVSLHNTTLGHWSAQGNFDWDGRNWDVSALNLSNPEIAAGIVASARYRPTGPLADIGIDLQWHGLRWPLAAGQDALVASSDGTARVSGTLDDYRVNLATRIDAAATDSASLHAEARGNRSGLQLTRADMQWLAGAWQATGAVGWSDGLQGDLAITVRHADPGRLSPDWQGKVNGRADLRVGRDRSGTKVYLALHSLDGELRGRKLKASASVSLTNGEIGVRDLRLAIGDANLRASASLGSEWDITWQFAADDLGSLYPGLAGTLHGRGSLHGSPRIPHVVASFDGEGLAFGERHIAKVDAEIDANPAVDGPLNVNIRASDINLPEARLTRFSLKARGTGGAHTVTISADGVRDLRAQVELQGGWDGRDWRGRITTGDVAIPSLGTWRQVASANLHASRTLIALDENCWMNGEARVCLQGTWRAPSVAQAELHWHAVPLTLAHELAPTSAIRLFGTVDGEAAVQFADGTLQRLDARLAARDGSVEYPMATDGTRHRMNFMRLDATGHADPERGAQMRLELAIDDTQHLRLDLSLPNWELSAPVASGQSIAGNLSLRIEDLTPLALWFPDAQASDGVVQAELSISGTIAAPRARGNVRLSADTLTVPRLGLDLEAVTVATVVEAGNRWRLNAGMRSGGADLRIEGQGSFVSVTEWQARLTIRGERVEALRTPVAHVYASPNLQLEIRPGDIRISGTLTIPEAKIELIEPQGIAVSPDVVIVGAPAAEASASVWKMGGQIQLILGDSVRLTGQGFSGRLAGQLQLGFQPDGTLSGHGELRTADARYRARGQNLTVTQGRLLYAGESIDNPALDIIAVRKTDEVEAGIRITGTAKKPEIRLFSTPLMDDSDILSYLILGRPMSQATSSDGQALYQAATSLAIIGSEILAEHIAARFGLQEVRIETGKQTTDTALVLGKSLSPRLYIRYIQGLVEASSAVRIRYDLSERWTIQTESGTQTGNGGDLLFNLETN